MGGDEAMRWGPHVGISALMKETPGSPIVPSPHEDTGEDAVYEPGSGVSPDGGSAGALILETQPPELWGIKVSGL